MIQTNLLSWFLHATQIYHRRRAEWVSGRFVTYLILTWHYLTWPTLNLIDLSCHVMSCPWRHQCWFTYSTNCCATCGVNLLHSYPNRRIYSFSSVRYLVNLIICFFILFRCMQRHFWPLLLVGPQGQRKQRRKPTGMRSKSSTTRHLLILRHNSTLHHTTLQHTKFCDCAYSVLLHWPSSRLV